MAKFRIRKIQRGPLPYRYVFLLTFVFFIFSTAAGLWIINKGIAPTLMSYADSQTRKIASLVINKAVIKKTVNVKDINNIFVGIPGKNGKSSGYTLKTDVINRVLAETTMEVQKNIKMAEKGDLAALGQLTEVDIETNKPKNLEGIIWYVPLGQATNIALLGNLGPKIPVRFNAIGDVHPDVKTEVKQIGINNVWIDISIHLVVSIQIITPFATKITKLEQTVPIGKGLIEGDVPQYYNGGGNSSPSIELPGSGN